MLRRTVRALIYITLVLCAGFATYAGAYLVPVRGFGVLAAGAIAVAFDKRT